MTLFVLLPVHNRNQVTSRFIDALVKQSMTDYCLVLVDDGCTDGTVEMVRHKLPDGRLVLLSGDGTLWWAGALQLGYKYLQTRPLGPDDAVLMINDDVSFGADFLSNGLAVLAEHPKACIQAIGVDPSSGSVDRGAIADVVKLRFRAADAGEAPNCLSTRGLLMTASAFLESGGFRPRWLPHYLSDYEFTLRLQRRGTPLRVDDRFSAHVRLELTGLSEPSSASASQFWKDSFSNRAKFNPRHWSAFIVMVCPAWVVPWRLARLWFRFFRSLLAVAWPARHSLQR